MSETIIGQLAVRVDEDGWAHVVQSWQDGGGTDSVVLQPHERIPVALALLGTPNEAMIEHLRKLLGKSDE